MTTILLVFAAGLHDDLPQQHAVAALDAGLSVVMISRGERTAHLDTALITLQRSYGPERVQAADTLAEVCGVPEPCLVVALTAEGVWIDGERVSDTERTEDLSWTEWADLYRSLPAATLDAG